MTGASSGLGRETALQLANDHGATVIVTGRRTERLDALVGEAPDGSVIPMALDLMDDASVDSLVSSLSAERLDGVILNAGVTSVGRFAEADLSAFEAVLQTNVAGNIRLLHGLTPALEKSRGQVQIVASMAGLMPVPYQSVYAGSKAFMVNFGLSLREELKQKDITVSVFAPGGIATEMSDIKEFEALKSSLTPVDEVARDLIKGYRSGKPLRVPGGGNRFVVGLSRFLPRSFLGASAERIYRKGMG